MSQKIWKIFGIFGMICLVLLVLLVFFGSFSARKMVSYSPSYRGGESGFYLPAPPMGLSEFSFEKSTPETSFQPSAERPSRMIVKTGSLNLVVKDVLETAKKIAKFAEEIGGWVVSTNISEYQKVPSGSITVRVPAEKFEEAKEYFRSLAVRVTNERVQSQDITEEYVDLESRLKNLEATESQLLELMKRSGTVGEILQVQKELTNVREQIEKIKGKMQYLEQSVKMSSITVNLALSEELLPIPPTEKWRPKYVLLQSWKNVVNFWKGFSYFLIRLVVWGQVWVPALIIFWFVRKTLKKRKMVNQ